MAKGRKALKRRKRDQRQGRQALIIGIAITIALVVLIYFLSVRNF